VNSPVLRALVALTMAVCALAAAPAFAQNLHVETVARGLDHPWAVAFLPDGRFLVTERPGRMRVVQASGAIGPALAGVPAVAAGGQGGLLDLVLDAGFEHNRQLFFCFSQTGSGGSSTALARARLAPDESRLEDVRVIFVQRPKVWGNLQFGCRIVESPDHLLFLALGDRFFHKADAQKLDSDLGKVVRITKDGAPAPGNPFVGRKDVLPEIWTYGHRNPEGAAWGPDGHLWIHEHGPQGGDEINVLRAGHNYGWPVITYGENYGGGKIGAGITHAPGMDQPLHYWVPSIAPSGMAFLTSDRYGPSLKGNLFVGSLKFGYVARLELADGKVVREHKELTGLARVRDVRQGPDGRLYLLTDLDDGRLLRVVAP
jgi:aldose sugar dehydrogenase